MLVLKHGFEGPFQAGVWAVADTESNDTMKLHGKYASMLSLLLSGYQFRPDFHPLDAFTQESVEAGRAAAKVVLDESPEVAATEG